VSRYQKGKTNLDFTVARDSEWQWHQLSRMQVCTSLQTDNQADTPPLSFLQAGCLSCRPTNSVKALKAKALSHTGRQLQYQLDIRMTANALSSSLFHHKAHTVITGLGCYHQKPVAECLFMSTEPQTLTALKRRLRKSSEINFFYHSAKSRQFND